MKVVHVSTVHSRYDVRIYQKECRSLAAAGYEVHLVVADGLGDEQSEFAFIHDVGRRSKNRFVRMLWGTFSAMSFAVGLRPKIIHIHDPELLASIFLAKFRKIGTIYDIHENTRRQILLKKYLPSILRNSIALAFGVFEDFMCRRLSATVVPQKAMQVQFGEVSSTCIELPNYVDLNLYPLVEKSFEKAEVFHAGGLSRDRGLENMVAAANEMGNRAQFFLAGSLENGFSKELLGKATFLGALPYHEVLAWYVKSNVGVILYNNVGQYGMAGAVKSFEYMAASMPFLMPNFGEWLDFNKKVNCGINVDVTDRVAVAAAINWLIENPVKAKNLGKNGRVYVETTYSWQAVSGRLVSLYEKILKTSRS